MATPSHFVALSVILSFIFVGTGVSQISDEITIQSQREVNWDDEQLRGELEGLCLNDHWTQAGQLLPGVDFSNILYTVRSAWQAESLLQVASLVCTQYGPVLNVLSDGFVRNLCEPVIDSVNQGKKVNITGICNQLWQMFEYGGISFEPPCQRESTDDKWPSGPFPTYVYDPAYQPDGTDDTGDHGSPFWLDIWQIFEETFSSLKDSDDFCNQFSDVMFNDSIASFDVVDHALHAIFESLLSNVFETMCANDDYEGKTNLEPDAATLVLVFLTETNGTDSLCKRLRGSNGHFSEEDLTNIAKSAKDKIFEVLLNNDTCLSLYEAMSPFKDAITQTTGLYLGGLVCDYIISSFTSNNEPSGTVSGISFDGAKEFINGNHWTSSEEFGFIMPSISFQEVVTALAQVLNSNTAANGMKILCPVLNPILDEYQKEMCFALEEHDSNRFIDSCHNFQDKNDTHDCSNIEGIYLINEFFQHFSHLQEITSQFNHDIQPHNDMQDFLQSMHHYDLAADYEDTCSIVGNILYESDYLVKDIILTIIEKELILLYHIAPHFCQVPLDPEHQWPGEGPDLYPDSQWPGDYDHEETWTRDTPFNDDGKNDPGILYDKYEDTTNGWVEVTHDGDEEHYHYPPNIDQWWDIKFGTFQAKTIQKMLAFLSGYSGVHEFCFHAIETFNLNETLYKMQALEKVQQMKENLIRSVEEYDSCIPFVYILKENMTESEFLEISGYERTEDLCWDIVSAFSSTGQDPNKDTESLIHLAGQVYNAPILDGAKLLCDELGDSMNHFEKGFCGFLQSLRPKNEFIEYCQNCGTYDDDHYHHHSHHDHHDNGGSFLEFLPWEHLPDSLLEVFGIPFSSDPICTLGWDLFTSQSVKTSLQKGFQLLTRLLIFATEDVECESDYEYYTYENETHVAINYFYNDNKDEDEGIEFVILKLLYIYLGEYDNSVALCINLTSALEDTEAINDIVAKMTNRLFRLLENQTDCSSFLNEISTQLLNHNSADMTVGKLVGMESNEDFCSSLTSYMTGRKDLSFTVSALFGEFSMLSNMSSEDVLINPTLTDSVLQLAAYIYRSNNIREAIDLMCPEAEMIKELNPELDFLDACFYLQTMNSSSFKQLCTENLQFFIPYFWIWVNHNSNQGRDQDYWDNDNDYHDFNVLNQLSIYTITRIFTHTFGVVPLDSTVFCYGVDGWLQSNSGGDMLGTFFRFFQTVLISQSFNICPTHYYNSKEPPMKQPDLDFDGTDFINVIGAINTFLGNYSDYEYLCWDVQTAYLEWDYYGDSTRMDIILDQLTGKFMEVLHDVDECLALTSAMNRLPIVGPVAAQIGFESNEMFCEFVVTQFESTHDAQVNFTFIQLLFSGKHEDSGEQDEELDEMFTPKWEYYLYEQDEWTQHSDENIGDDGQMLFEYLRLAVQEVITILVGINNQEVAMSALNYTCVAAHQITPNNISVDVSFICDQIERHGSILGTCLGNFSDMLDAHMGNTPSNVNDTLPDSKYLGDLIHKLQQILGHIYNMYSGYGLNYNRFEEIAFNIQKILNISSFDLTEPFSGCSLLRLVVGINHGQLVNQLRAIMAYPIGDFLEYMSQFGLCHIDQVAAGTTGEENIDVVAYRLLKNLLQLFSSMDHDDFCQFLTDDHTTEEYHEQGQLIADKMFEIFSDEATCVNFLSVVTDADRYDILFNLTGMDLSENEGRLAFCEHLVSSFSGETQYVSSEYTLPTGETLENWQPFSIPGQLLPQLKLSHLVSIAGAVYASPTLLEGTGVLCDVFHTFLANEDYELGFSVDAVCLAVKGMNFSQVEMLCRNYTVPEFYGDYYPINLRPINGDRVGMSILLELLGTARLTRESEVCPALDGLLSSNRSLSNVVFFILDTWLKELIPTAVGVCQSWDEIVLYLSPMSYFGTYSASTWGRYNATSGDRYNSSTGDRYNASMGNFDYWTTTNDNEEKKEDQEFYYDVISNATHLISTILGFPDRESLCNFIIENGTNTTTGIVTRDILVTIRNRLSAVFTDVDKCTLVIESIFTLLHIDLHMIPALYDITGYESPRAFCGVTTEFLADEGCSKEVDCFGVCGGSAILDCAGVCNGTSMMDCTGVCNGKSELDCFGVCEGDAIADCSDECGGKAVLSDCTNECVGGSTGKPLNSGFDECDSCTMSEDYKDVRDCAGTCSGTASVDLCGECTGGETGLTFDESRIDCNGECDGTAFEDCLGNCITAGETGAEEDACGICDGPNSVCVFAFGLFGMEADVQTELTVTGEGFDTDEDIECVFIESDETTFTSVLSVSDNQNGVCSISLPEGTYFVHLHLSVDDAIAGGDPHLIDVWSACSEVVDCTGVCGGGTVVDCNGECGGSAVLDCADMCGGTLEVDCAGICGGDTQEDCAGNCNGDTPVDCSGTCNGTAQEDCSGVCQGTAFVNECGYCVGGTTGRSELLGYDQCGVCKSTDGYTDTRDCHGTCNGQAYVDECGECVGGETGIESSYEQRKDCNDVCDGTWQEDACNMCEPDGDSSTSKYKDCSGTCVIPGSGVEEAYLNGCGECVGGQTGLAENYGIDACGVCGGTNETCKGCDGIPNSNVVNDACGVCGGTGSSCIVVSSLSQNIIVANEVTEMIVSGAGFTSDKVYTCTFSGPEDVTTSMTPSDITSGTCTVTLPQIGAYTFTLLADNEAVSVADGATVTVIAINDVTIESISPSTPLASTGPTAFTITGNPATFAILRNLDVPLHINVYESGSSDSEATQLTASFDEGSTNTLIFSHNVTSPGPVVLKLYFDGFGELPGDGLELIFYAPSPELTALYFNNLGSAIIAEFGSQVETLVLEECNDILADISKIGSGASCQWQSPQRLTIAIGNGDNLVSVGDTLTFNRANIQKLFELYPYPEEADSVIEMTVAAPDTVPSVRAALYGSSVISNCGRVKGLLYTLGAAGRELSYEWTVSSSGNTSDLAAALAELSSSTLDVDGALLDAGVDYIISVVVTNFFGGSATASLTVQRSVRETPDVIVNVIGIDKDNAYLSESAVLVADISYTECAPVGETVFSWSVDSDEVALSLKRSSRNLFIPANSLPGGASVTFTVRIYKSSEPENYVEESITITTRYSDLEPVISQGKFITVGQDNGNVNLDGSLSSDPDNVAVVMTYEWLCEQYDRDMFRIQQALSDRKKAFRERQITDNTACWSYKSGHSGETILENANATNAVLTFDAQHMDINKVYMYTLLVRKGLRSASTFILVTPVAGSAPKVSINPVTGSQLSGDILAIQATITHTSALSQAVWSTTDTDTGNGYLDLTDSMNFITSPILHSSGSDISFSFFTLQRNVLTPGATYSLKLTATTVDDKTSEATVEVKVRSLVTSCVISLDGGSSSYTELQSMVLALDSCTTDEDAYPLTFQVFLQNTDGSYESKTTAEASDRISIVGPPAQLTNDDVPYNTFRVKVCNKFAVCGTFEESFNVDTQEFDQVAVNNAFETNVEVEKARQNYEKALVNINMLVIRVGSVSVANSFTTSSRRRRAVDVTSAVNQERIDLVQLQMDNNVMDTNSADLLISELSAYDTDDSTQDDMETLVDQYTALIDVFTDAGEPIPDVSSVKMLEKLKEIKDKVPLTAGRIRKKISNVTSGLEKTHFRDLLLGGEERKTETDESKLVLKKDIPQSRMTFDSSFSVKMAADIISNFGGGWSCSSGSSCSGVTFRFKLYNDSVDEYSQTEEDIANRAAAIVEFSLHDPDSGDELTISDLSDTINFNITITRPQSNMGYECRFWNSTTSEWSNNGLTTLQIGADVVTCESYHLSTFTVVVVDLPTTVPPTTQPGGSSEGTSDSASETSSVTGSIVDIDDEDAQETTRPDETDETSAVGTDETTPTESVKAGGDDSTDDSSTQGNTPVPSGGGSGVVIGVIVGVVVLVLVGAAMIGVLVFLKMKGGNNKVNSESNFEAAHPAPTAPQPVAAPAAESPVSASPQRAKTPVAFETADPVAVPLKAEPDMPPPPSVFVPPGDEATVSTETEVPHHPHSPEPSMEPEIE